MIKNTTPSTEDIEYTRHVLSKLRPGQLPLGIFIEVARLTVTPILEIVPLRRSAMENIQVLLCKRDETDPTWPGMLHTPGTVIRASDQGRHNEDAFKRIIDGELQSLRVTQPVFVENILHPVKRGMEQAQI